MVKKLFKHEILAYLRMLTPIYIILCGIAVMSRILQFFENSNGVYSIIFGTSIVIYVVSIAAALILTMVFIIIRFYKHMFSAEGYLTHTLPVTVNEHIFVKIATAMLSQVATLIAVIASVAIITSGELLVEVFKAISYLYNTFSTLLKPNLLYYIIEVIILLIVALIAETLLFYAVISVGQLSRKNRVIASIGVYFAYYVISQIIGTVFVVAITLMSNTVISERVTDFIEKNPFKTVHIAFIGMTVFYALLSIAYYFITSIIVRKKLNLE